VPRRSRERRNSKNLEAAPGLLYRRAVHTHVHRGFSLLETLIALVLVGISMTALLVTFVGSGNYGVMSRRQATAMAVARTTAAQLSHADWAETTAGCPTNPTCRLVNNNAGNDVNFADPNGKFESATTPTGADAPDSTLASVTVGNETFDVFVNVSPQADPINNTVEMGRYIAVIVRYRVGSVYRRAVATGFHYNPGAVGVGTLPL